MRERRRTAVSRAVNRGHGEVGVIWLSDRNAGQSISVTVLPTWRAEGAETKVRRRKRSEWTRKQVAGEMSWRQGRGDSNREKLLLPGSRQETVRVSSKQERPLRRGQNKSTQGEGTRCRERDRETEDETSK